MARDAPRAVVFRRGPSKQVLLVSWNTNEDSFEIGQWLKGRAYERRCDLSPSGRHLVYFAANWKTPYGSWSAISRPPFFTALALWPKGDGWGGGGLFDHERLLALNHRDPEMQLAEGHELPPRFSVKPFGQCPGWGEDDPIWDARLSRDGWAKEGEERIAKSDFDAPVWIVYDPPVIYVKQRLGKGLKRLELRMIISGIKEREGPWYVIDHEVLDSTTGRRLRLRGSDWADWDRNGDLLYASKGRIYRLDPAPDGQLVASARTANELIDLAELRFEQRKTPGWALQW